MMRMDKLEIKNLAYCKKHVPAISKWMWEEWDKKNGIPLKAIEYRTRHCLGKKSIPMTFVGIVNERPVATVSLWRNDVNSRQDLFPWLAALFVAPEMRKLGLGREMQEFALAKAGELGFGKIYLMTSYKNYYEKNGWKFIDMAPLESRKKTRIYSHKLSSSPKNNDVYNPKNK
ncbi:MAG TPA: GNAT family N-acetyltransferase [archaeon]|nr:GNAT family N-acetyltransferase [archaeon]